MGKSLLDLHTHSNRSDGLDSPSYLLERAKALGVTVLALADHDTVDGWQEAHEAAVRNQLGLIPAIEVSTHSEVFGDAGTRRISVHLLAYLPDPTNAEFMGELKKSRDSRLIRAKKMVELLSEDYPINWLSIEAEMRPGATVGRPAIADALVTAGIVADRTEAFREILAKGSKYYLSEHSLETAEAIALIKNSGGVPVMAHPLMDFPAGASMGDLATENFLRLIEAGLAGLEIEHRQVPENARNWLRELAAEHNLIFTGSSDYHGVGGKINELGENSTQPEQLNRILDLASGYEAYFPSGRSVL